MPQTRSVYERGQFFQQLGGPYEVSAEDVASTRGYFGLDFGMTFLYGNIRTEDGEMYEVNRNFPAPGRRAEVDEDGVEKGAAATLLLVQSTEIDGESLQFDRTEIAKHARSSDARITLEDGRVTWLPAVGATGAPFRVEFDEHSALWEEEGLMRMTGTALKPGLQWYLPGRDYGTYYVSVLFQLEGEYKGKKATGMIGFDQVYMGEGGELYTRKDLVMENRAHLIWYTWATRYTDGSWEGGHFMLGNGPMGFALFTDGTVTTSTRDITGQVFPAPDSVFAERIELTVDGQDWEFLPADRGTMPDMLRKHPPTPQQEGRWQRVGETRTPEVWFAWGETEHKHGLIPAERLATEEPRAQG